MNAELFQQFFIQYGAVAIFVIVLLEYLNMPGFPAGVIMPLAGVWAARGSIGFGTVMLITVLAGVLGSLLLYALGYAGGSLFLDRYLKKFPKQRAGMEKNFTVLKKWGCLGIFAGKLIPMVRTLISIPAGVLKMNFWQYLFSSALGVALWNLIFVGAGYFLGDAVLARLA